MQSLEVHDEIQDVSEPLLFDEGISSWQYYKYTPQTQANNNTPGHQIAITIQDQDIYSLPSKSYLTFRGQIKRENDAAYAAAAEVTLTNNAMMYLFTSMKYNLGSTTIETITSPGQTTTMLGYLSYPDDFSTSAGLKYCWSKDTTDDANSAKYAPNVAAPGACYTPAENPNYNQGFETRKGFLFSSDPLGHFEFN